MHLLSVSAPHWSVRRSIVSFSARTSWPRGMGRPGVLAVYVTPGNTRVRARAHRGHDHGWHGPPVLPYQLNRPHAVPSVASVPRQRHAAFCGVPGAVRRIGVESSPNPYSVQYVYRCRAATDRAFWRRVPLVGRRHRAGSHRRPRRAVRGLRRSADRSSGERLAHACEAGTADTGS
jgi:hypothetical protein